MRAKFIVDIMYKSAIPPVAGQAPLKLMEDLMPGSKK